MAKKKPKSKEPVVWLRCLKCGGLNKHVGLWVIRCYYCGEPILAHDARKEKT